MCGTPTLAVGFGASRLTGFARLLDVAIGHLLESCRPAL
jgi:hypothetical protein